MPDFTGEYFSYKIKSGDSLTKIIGAFNSQLKAEGKIRYYGVSVETMEEGMFCMEQPNVSALQIIFNLLRQKPLDELLPASGVRLHEACLDRIDSIVAPGTNVNPPDSGWTPPWLSDARLRRRWS